MTFKHTDAARIDAFMAKSPAAQALEIWLNGNETNGHVADQATKIAEMGLEIQKARLTISEHLDGHPVGATVQTHLDDSHDAAVQTRLIKKLGGWGTAALAALVSGLGGAILVLQIIQTFRQ